MTRSTHERIEDIVNSMSFIEVDCTKNEFRMTLGLETVVIKPVQVWCSVNKSETILSYKIES